MYLRESKETPNINDEADPMLTPQDAEMMIPTNDGAEEQALNTSASHDQKDHNAREACLVTYKIMTASESIIIQNSITIENYI